MTTIFKTMAIVLIGGLAMTTTSCKKEGCTDDTATNFNHDAEKDNGSCEYATGNTVNLSVEHKFGTDVFSFDSVYTDPQGTKYKFTRTEFYMSNFKFLDMSMNLRDSSNEVFLVRSNTASLNLGKIDLIGHTHEITSKIGLDSLTNYTSDPTTFPAGHPLAPQVPPMYWTWNSGYIFFAVEGVYGSNGDQVIDGSDATFEMHLGSNSFQIDNSFTIMKDLVENEPLNLNLSLDYSQLFVGFDLMNDNTTHTMDNMPLANALKANLVNFISVN